MEKDVYGCCYAIVDPHAFVGFSEESEAKEALHGSLDQQIVLVSIIFGNL